MWSRSTQVFQTSCKTHTSIGCHDFSLAVFEIHLVLDKAGIEFRLLNPTGGYRQNGLDSIAEPVDIDLLTSRSWR